MGHWIARLFVTAVLGVAVCPVLTPANAAPTPSSSAILARTPGNGGPARVEHTPPGPRIDLATPSATPGDATCSVTDPHPRPSQLAMPLVRPTATDLLGSNLTRAPPVR